MHVEKDRLTEETALHPAAVVDARAELGCGVKIGPYAVIGPHVKLGDRTVVHPHAVIDGHTTIGSECEIFPSAAVGLRPQDKKYDGSPTRLEIGDRTVIREFTTLQPGTRGTGLGVTKIGSDCLIMAYVHVAHDCTVGNGVILANAVQIAGHAEIGDHAVLGGVTTVHQFVRIGTRAITGASARIQQDVPPYMMADGHPARLFGLNAVGLKRAGFSRQAQAALKTAYKELFLRGHYVEARETLERTLALEHAEVAHLLAFIRGSKRGVMRAGRKGRTRDANED